MVSVSDLDAEVQASIGIGSVIEDLNGDGTADIVILEKGEQNVLTLRTYLCRSDCVEQKPMEVGIFFGVNFLRPIPIGCRCAGKAIENGSFELVTYGKSSVCFSWDSKNGALVNISASD